MELKRAGLVDMRLGVLAFALLLSDPSVNEGLDDVDIGDKEC